MADYSLSLNAVAHNSFNVNDMSGHEKVLLTCAVITKGDVTKPFGTKDITSVWSKTALKAMYRPTFLQRAKDRNWIASLEKSQHCITQDGLDHLDSIARQSFAGTVSTSISGLRLFRAGETHSFDKHLRQLLSGAGAMVRIIDSYVDETVFDNLLDQIPKQVRIRLLYGKSYNTFSQRETRFSHEYTRYSSKKNVKLHDRLMIIDSVGYILGPSLKDAAKDSPATFVRLNAADSQALIKFFDELWKAS